MKGYDTEEITQESTAKIVEMFIKHIISNIYEIQMCLNLKILEDRKKNLVSSLTCLLLAIENYKITIQKQTIDLDPQMINLLGMFYEHYNYLREEFKEFLFLKELPFKLSY